VGVLDDEIDNRKKQSDLFLKQITAVRNQARSTLNDADCVRLTQQAEDLKEQYEAMQKEIKRLQSDEPLNLSPELLNRLKAELRRDWEQELMWLNYDRPENNFHQIVRIQRQNAVLLLVKQGVRMKADLFIRRIRKCILDERRIKPYCEVFTEYGAVDTVAFAEKWRASLQLMPSDGDLTAVVQSIVAALQGSVRSGQILYLQIELDTVADGFFAWFLEAFWKALACDKAWTQNNIPVVAVVTLEDVPESPDLFDNLCCSNDDFKADQYFEVELTHWSKADIERWMNDYLKPSLDRLRISFNKPIQPFAARVHRHSNQGVPLHAHNLIVTDILNEIFQPLGAIHHAAN